MAARLKLSSVSADKLHFAVSLSLGWAPSGQGPPPAQPKSALLNQRSPHRPPTTRPENPSCRRLLTERLPVPQNGTPLRPIVIRYQVHVLALFSGSGSLFPLPLGLLIICHHRPRPRGGLARPNPNSVASRTPLLDSRVESRAPSRRNSLLARLAQLARSSITDRVFATTTLAAASAATAALAAASARLLT